MTQSLSSGCTTCTQLYTHGEGLVHHIYGLHPSLQHTCVFSPFLLYLEKHSFKSMCLLIYASWKVPCFEGELTVASGGTHLISLSAGPGRVSNILHKGGGNQEIGEAQTLLGDTRCLRLTDRHINTAKTLSFPGWHPEIWDTHRPYARDQRFEMNTGTTHLKHGDVALQKIFKKKEH